MWSPFLAGFLIAAIAAIFGVGGGFLLVPYMSAMLHMPMHIIPATSGAVYSRMTAQTAAESGHHALKILDEHNY